MRNRNFYTLLFIIKIWALISCTARQKFPVLNIKKDIVDFGEIKYDSVLKIYFEYQNDGSDSLKLINASADCGCTHVNYNNEAIAPGQKGVIEVTYIPKSNSDSGFVTKNIALRTNLPSPIKVIKIKGTVIK